MATSSRSRLWRAWIEGAFRGRRYNASSAASARSPHQRLIGSLNRCHALPTATRASTMVAIAAAIPQPSKALGPAMEVTEPNTRSTVEHPVRSESNQ